MAHTKKQKSARIVTFLLMIVMVLSFMVPVSAEEETSVDNPENYVSELTGERVVDGVGEQSGVRYQPEGYTWDPDVESETIDGVEYWTYDIDGIEGNDLGIQMQINCDPLKANAIEEGTYESQEELDQAVEETIEKIEAIEPEEETQESKSLLDLIFPKAKAYTLSELGIDFSLFTDSNGNEYDEADGARTYFKRVTYSSGSGSTESSSFAYCISPNKSVPDDSSYFSSADIIDASSGRLAIVARCIYYGYGRGGWSYLDTDAAVFYAAGDLASGGLVDTSGSGSWAQNLINHYNSSTACRNLVAAAQGEYMNDGYDYTLVRLNASGNSHQNVIAVYRRTSNTPDPVYLQIFKVDKKGQQGLAGARFKVEWNGKSDTTNETDGTGRTDKTVNITNDDIGKTMTVTEIQAPTGYKLSSTPVSFTIEAGKTYTVDKLKFENEPETMNLQILKVDKDEGTKTPLAGARFRIEWNGKYTETNETDPNGRTDVSLKITADDIGKTATVKEIQAPTGYDLSGETKEVTVEAGSTIPVEKLTFSNKVKPISIKLKKTAKDGTSAGLPGAQFKVEFNGKSVTTGKTDANGCVTVNIDIDKADVGTDITITEVQAPVGYVLGNVTKKEKVEAGKTYDLTQDAFEDEEQYGKLTVYKTGDVFDHFEKVSDNEYKAVYTTQKLKGCVFEVIAKNDLKDADGSIVFKKGDVAKTITTDANGVVSANDLKLGTYTVKEISAPAGYILADPFDVEIKYGSQTESVVEVTSKVHNKWESGDMSLIKVDGNVSEENRPSLAGAVLKIFRDNDGKKTEIGSLTTDTNGTIKLTNFPVGKYYYQETKSPNGYLCDTEQKLFEIYMGKNSTKLSLETDVENFPAKASIELLKTGQDRTNYKVSGKTGSYNTTYETIPVKNCKFNLVAVEDIYSGGILRAKAGDIIAKYTTDSNGKGVVASYYYRSEGCTLGDSATDLTSLTKLLQTDRTDDAYIGKYKLVETSVPSGFRLLSDPINVEITYNSQKMIAVFDNPENIFNEIEKGDFEFTKTSLTTGKPIPGVSVKIYDEKKNVVATPVTDSNGKFTIKDLPTGKYYYQEYDAPVGFVIDESLYPFEINEGKVTKATMEDDAQLVEISLIKNGEDYGDYYVDENGQVWFEEKAVEGAGFAVVATQDIKLSDNATSVLAYAGDIVAHGVTDEDGKVTFTDYSYRKGTTAEAGTDLTKLEEGTLQMDNAIIGNTADATVLYQLVEEITPEHYRDLESPINVTIGAGTDHVALQTTALSAFNYAKKGTFDFTKTDIVTGEPLPNTTITIYKEDGETVIFTGKTDENGKITIKDLPEGKYYYQEHEAPYGYIIDEGLYEFEITDNEITMAELADKLAMGDPILEKLGEDYENYTVDKDGNVVFQDKALAGAKFAIVATEDIKQYDGASTYRAAEGDIIGYVTTDENGIGTTSEYYFRDGKTLTEAVADDADTTENEVVDEAVNDGNIVPLNANAEEVNTETTEGEVEEVEETEPIVLPAGTDLTQQTEGVEVFEHVFLGNYKFAEVEAPERYLLSEEEYPFTVEYVDQYTEFIEVHVSADNLTKTGDVIISKVDVATGEPIPGATITIYDDNKNVIFEKVSDENGEVKLHRLPLGHYYYQETNAPDGYELNEDLFEFEIKENDEVVRCQITNKKIENVDTGVFTDSQKTMMIFFGILAIGAVVTNAAIYFKKRH